MIKFTHKQQEALRLMCDAYSKSILLYDAAQSAKTYVGLLSILIRAMKYPNSVHAICRLRLVDLRASILLNKFPEVVKHRFWDASIDRTEFHYVYSYPSYVKFSNGSTIFFLCLEDNKGFDKILAPSYTTVIIDEAAEVPYQAYTKLITRLSQNNQAKKFLLLTMNPTTKRHLDLPRVF
jgi:phage terminase large subunit